MIRKLLRLRRDRAGNILIITALSMPVVIGAGGLATDTVQWTVWQRQIQRQADSAALAGAYARSQDAGVVAAATADINRHSFVALLGSPTIENAPTTGAYAGNMDAVRVVLKTQRSLPFSSLFLSSAPILTVEATAAVLQNGNYCVISLERTPAAGITIDGNATVNMGCGMSTNSSSTAAVTAGGSSNVYATPISAVGGLPASSHYASGTVLLPYSVPQADPFESLPEPVLPTPCSPKLSVNPTETRNVVPDSTGVGCFRGMDLKGTVHFDPGVYYIDGGEFSAGSQAVISGSGVTFILTSNNATSNPGSIATIDMNGGASVNLTAPTSGTYSGVLFYQDRRALDNNDNKINGNSGSKLEGAIYMPGQSLTFNGTSGMNTECLQLVSRRVGFSGNTNITNNCPTGGSHSFTGTRVELVG